MWSLGQRREKSKAMSLPITNCPHVDRPYCAKGRCKSCYNSFYEATHLEYRARSLQRQRDYNKRNSKSRCAQNRRLHLLRAYKLTEKQYDELVNKQNGRCAICNSKDKSKKLAVDHAHDVTQRVRGLLCLRCNTKLEWFLEHEEAIFTYLGRDEKKVKESVDAL